MRTKKWQNWEEIREKKILNWVNDIRVDMVFRNFVIVTKTYLANNILKAVFDIVSLKSQSFQTEVVPSYFMIFK